MNRRNHIRRNNINKRRILPSSYNYNYTPTYSYQRRNNLHSNRNHRSKTHSYQQRSNSRYNANGKDLNRNYDFSQTPSNSFSEIESRCIREMVGSHDFITSISWHSGVHMIAYPWGASAHGGEASPDNDIYRDMAILMANEGGNYQEGKYDYGRCNQLYTADGGYQDWVYGAKDEPQNTNNGPYGKANVLNFVAEVSNTKTPPSNQVTGWSTKNWKIAKVCIDFGMSYARFTSTPANVAAGSQFNVKWLVGGCFDADVTQIAYSDVQSGITASTPTGNNWYGLTSQKSGKSFWYNSNGYSSTITAPNIPGTYYLAIRLQVDSNYYNSGVFSSLALSRHNKLYFSVIHSFKVS